MALTRAALDPAAADTRPGHDALFRTVDRLTGACCVRCARALCGHEAVVVVAMGIERAPRCLRCFADGIGAEQAAVLRQVRAQLSRRTCYVAAWERVAGREPWCGIVADR
jgi:hypothetical protein